MFDNRYQRSRATCAHIFLQVLPQVSLKARMLEMFSLSSDLLWCLDVAKETPQATFR